MRNTNKLVGWCVMASSYVRAKEDREEVKDELWAHIEDRYDSLLAGGVDDERAAELTLEAMGDAHEVGKLLRKIHKPYLSWAVTASKWLLILAALVWMYMGVFEGFIGNMVSEYDSRYDDYLENNFERTITLAEEDGDTVFLLDVKDTAECEGYTFSVPDAMQIRFEEEGLYRLNFGLRATHPMPWRDSPDAADEYIFAVDDLGNIYKSPVYTGYGDNTWIYSNGCGRSLFSHFYELSVGGIPQNAKWVELRYDRYGREFSLRINLEGGGTD